MAHIIGIGGVFLKAKNPKLMTAWYQEHLGIAFGDQTYFLFKEGDADKPAATGSSVFSFKEESKYFNPSVKPYMINFRVHDLLQMLEGLKKAGVEVVGDMEDTEYGKFGWIMDPEGNKIELWEEPVEQKH